MTANFIEQLTAEYRAQRQDQRATETTLGGTTVEIGQSETFQSIDDSVLGASLRGVPRGREALAAREIAETAPFQMILNAVNDQLLGGELVYPSDDEDKDQSEAELKALVADVLDGPHHGGGSMDDLITAWTTDMAVLGNAYGELLPPADDSDLPVAALKAVDAITIRHNVDDTGGFEDPAYYQAPSRSAGGGLVSVSKSDVTPLTRDELLMMQWPGSARSHRLYPLPPALQLKEWLTLIDDSTTHLQRYYSDNELPSGLLTARDANGESDVQTIRDELEAAKGDPRSAPVVDTDARWVEVGGSAVDLSHIEEQKWFLNLCMAAFGVPKTELGMDDQVNYATSESELQVVAKRVTSKVAAAISRALERQFLPQFDLYQTLDQPFGVDLRFSDPREERAEEERARQQWTDGVITLREYREAIGDDMSDKDTTVMLNGQEIDYGAYPRPVVESLLTDARNDDPPGTETAGE
jgi:hypothetical protein